MATVKVPRVHRRRVRRCRAQRQQQAAASEQDQCWQGHQGFPPHSSRDFSHSGHLIPFVLTTVSLSLVPIDRLIHEGSHVHGLAHE